ncbi:putative oxalyl-CoA decarboxylase [Helianthus anomalus]
MGVGLGYCIVAAVASPDRLVVAVEGDSGFGFSAMEVELPVVVIVFNNGGVYSGDKRNPEDITGPYKDDPIPTAVVPGAAYHLLIEAFGGKGYLFLQESLLLSMTRLIRMLVQKVARCNTKIEVCKLWFCLHFAYIWKNMH